MREKGKRLIAIILSCLLLLSNVTVYAATEAEEQSDTQNTVSVNASEEVVTLPEEPINGSAGEEAVIQNEPNAEDTSDETETLAPINATDPLEILETPKNMVGIEISSFNFLPTTRSVGIPTVGSTATGTCYIGDTWNVNYPYQDYFYVNNFTGDLTGAVTVQDFECLDPTAALPTHKNASYEATVTEVNAVGGYIEYYVRVTPPGATDGVTRPDGEHLSGYQHVGGKVRVYRAFAGSLELIKSSANQTITNGNSCYSLKGAVYGLYQNGIEIARKTTDVNGYAKFENVTAGNYDLKEITPPKGYALDKRTYPVTINSSQTTRVDVKDYPQSDPVSILLGKVDKDTTQNMPQGSASLEGAEFTIKYYAVHSDKDPAESGKKPVRTWVLKTNKDGKTAMVDSLKVSGDEFFKTSQGYNTLPLGTITIQETKAPKGYLLNEEIFVRQITSKGTTEGVETYNMPTIEDITTPDGTVRAEKGTVVATLTTDDKGKAETDKLYLGKYVIKETKAPEGYLLNPKEFEVTLAYKDQTTEIVYGDVTVPDQPAKGKIRITKTDAETNKPIPLGAEFTVTAAEDITTPDGTVRAEKGTVVATLTTDDKGKAETDKLYLGKYVIKETKAPEGYLLNPKEFEVTLAYKDQTTEIVYGDVTVPNQPAKGQIEILKKDEETGNLLSGAEFTVTAAEDITTPDGTVRAEKGTVVDTIVTDTTGIARSKELYLGKYVVKETKQPIGFIRPNQTWDVELKYADQKTELVKENLTIKNQPTEIIIDKKETGTDKPLEGVKFVIWNKDKEDPIDPGMQHKEIYTTDANGKIRLLYLEPGNYAVAEVESIPGYAWDDKMIYEFTITEDGRVDGEVSHTIPVGNDRTEITETNAINVSTGTQDAFAVDLTIIDTVSIVNLMPNREYKLQLILADAKTGEPLKVKDQPSGDLLTTEKTFTADSSKMDVDMQIEFDASPFVGRTIVAYEYLYQDGVEISRHEDPNDKKQQIYVKDKLKLNTTAIDLISGTHEAIAKKDVTIRDNVDHFGLIKGQEYVLKGILMDQTTGKPLVINGKQITAEKSVQIETADGTVPIDFTLDASELNNRSIVVYEYLYHNGQLIASHEDITDEDQTITFKVGSLKPILPPNKGGGLLSALKTGDFSDIMPFAIALIGTGAIILSIVIYNHRKKKKREE